MMEAMARASMPGPQHAMLAGMSRDWTIEGKWWMAPGEPPATSTGIAERTMILGGRVLVEKITSSFMGMPFEGQGMTGYDNVTGEYWATWTDNASTALMTSTGSCDWNKCEWYTTATDPMTGQTTTTRMISEHHPDTEIHRAYEKDYSGTERLAMELKYTRAH